MEMVGIAVDLAEVGLIIIMVVHPDITEQHGMVERASMRSELQVQIMAEVRTMDVDPREVIQEVQSILLRLPNVHLKRHEQDLLLRRETQLNQQDEVVHTIVQEAIIVLLHRRDLRLQNQDILHRLQVQTVLRLLERIEGHRHRIVHREIIPRDHRTPVAEALHHLEPQVRVEVQVHRVAQLQVGPEDDFNRRV